MDEDLKLTLKYLETESDYEYQRIKLEAMKVQELRLLRMELENFKQVMYKKVFYGSD